MGCVARGVVFNWPQHGRYSVLHDLQDMPREGYGWFFHWHGRRLILQPLKSLVAGLGDPNEWAR